LLTFAIKNSHNVECAHSWKKLGKLAGQYPEQATGLEEIFDTDDGVVAKRENHRVQGSALDGREIIQGRVLEEASGKPFLVRRRARKTAGHWRIRQAEMAGRE
jgi:hypothetical protein